MASKKKSPKKAPAAKKRKVGAVVMKRRGAKARLRSALRTAEAGGRTADGRGGRKIDGGGGKDEGGLKRRISRIKTRTRAIASKLAKSGRRRSGSK